MLLGILFNVCLIAANLLETKVIQVGSLTVTAGLLVFPISYIINDCIAEVWGFKKARLIIWSGFAMNFFVVGLGLIAVAIPAAPFWEGEEHFDFVAFHAQKGDRVSAGFVADVQSNRSQSLRADQVAIEYDILLGEEIVRGAYRAFPKFGQGIEFGQGGSDEGTDHLRTGLRAVCVFRNCGRVRPRRVS